VNLTAGQTETKCQYCDSLVIFQQAEARLNEVKNSKIGGNLMLAETYFESGEYQKALSFCDKAIEQDGMSSEAWFGRGRSLLKDRSKKYIGDRAPCIDTTGTLSSLEAAIRFASNSQLMAKRAAKVIAEAVSEGLCTEKAVYPEHKYNGLVGVVYRTADYNALLGWAIDRDGQSEFVVRTGAEFYSRATPHANAHRVLHPPEGEFKEASEKFFASVNQNADRFLKALRQINPEAARQCDATLRKSQSAASSQLKESIEQKESGEGLRRQNEEFEKRLRRQNEAFDKRRSGKQEGCFVATACYEDYDHPVVMELRRFRDECLDASMAGQAFVRWYYQWSPTFARLVARSRILKVLARVLIVTPALTVGRVINKTAHKE
jgi:tetratricopeptide (TPR) repeat protein